MPQIPLFVSSSQAGAEQTGTFDVRFQPPLRIPEEGKNATVHLYMCVLRTQKKVRTRQFTFMCVLIARGRGANAASIGRTGAP